MNTNKPRSKFQMLDAISLSPIFHVMPQWNGGKITMKPGNSTFQQTPCRQKSESLLQKMFQSCLIQPRDINSLTVKNNFSALLVDESRKAIVFWKVDLRAGWNVAEFEFIEKTANTNSKKVSAGLHYVPPSFILFLLISFNFRLLD